MGLFDFFKNKHTKPSIVKTLKDSSVPAKPTYDTTISQDKKKDTHPAEKVYDQEGVPLLSTLLEEATPSKLGLYPHEIMMLEYAPYFKPSNNTFQNFWYWQYSVTEPQSILDKLYEAGFIKIGDLRSALEKLKLTDIKDELKQINQKLTGKKTELVDRLIEFGDLTYLNEKYSERHYTLTSKGEQELKENEYVSYLHRNKYMTVWEMNKRIAKTHYPYRDILWGYFNEMSGVHFQSFDFGLYRNTRFDMYNFLMEENKPKTAFHMLCEVLSFDLTPLSNNEKSLFEMEKNNPEFYLMCYEPKLELIFPYSENTLALPPGVVKCFCEIQTKLNYDDNEFRIAIIKELKEVHPPHRIFNDEECANIIVAKMHDDTSTLKMIFDDGEKRERVRLEKIRLSIKSN